MTKSDGFNCPYCNERFETNRACGNHKKLCKCNPLYAERIERLRLGGKIASKPKHLVPHIDYDVICDKCGKQFTINLTEHQYNKRTKFYCSRACANARTHSALTKTKIAQSLVKRNNKPISYCKSCGTILKRCGKLCCCRTCLSSLPEFRARLSAGIKRNGHAGGYRINSTYGHHGWYKGIYCDSSWELAYVIYNIDHGIIFKRNTERFTYTYKGKSHKYLPDFIIGDTYIEIKGRWTDKWQAKLDQFPKSKKLKVLVYKDVKPYIEYARHYYGRNFIDLYEHKTSSVDYSKWHWYTNKTTGKRTKANHKLGDDWVLGRLNINV